MKFLLLNYSQVLEFAREYLINQNNYLNIGLLHHRENFEFVRQRICEYKRKLSSRKQLDSTVYILNVDSTVYI